MKYTKSELISVAKSMQIDDETFVELLNDLENRDWTQFVSTSSNQDEQPMSLQLTFSAFKPPKLIRSQTSFVRQRSELTADVLPKRIPLVNKTKKDIIEPVSKLSRMISSPQIKWNRNQASKRIEIATETALNAETSRRKRKSLDAGKLQNLTRIEHSTKLESRRAREFGSQYNESNIYSRAPNHNSLLAENLMRSPVVKLGPTNHSPNHNSMLSNANAEAEDSKCSAIEQDDFDITSLLSITVLSDIKTIRQSEYSSSLISNRKSGTLNTNEPKFGAKQRTSPSKDKATMKQLGRAKTFNEFHYNRIAARPHNPYDMQDYQYYEPSGPESYVGYDAAHWAASQQYDSLITFDPIRADTFGQKATTKVTKQAKPMDDNVRQIIESFKAQVQARAKGIKLEAEAEAKPTPDLNEDVHSKASQAEHSRNQSQPKSSPKKSVDFRAQPSKLPRLVSLQSRLKATETHRSKSVDKNS